MTKVCLACEQEKSIEDFYKFHDKWADKKYLSSRCKICHQQYKRDSATTPKNRKAEKLKLRYGLTYEEWELMREKENYSCMICGITEDEIGRVLDVDHCHISGKARGVLCNSCNNVLGKAKDNIDVLRAAITYLETYREGYK